MFCLYNRCTIWYHFRSIIRDISVRCLVVSRSLESKMADLLGDDSHYTEENNEDPAADFLAREQNDLADLGEDFEGDANAAEVGNV